MRDNSWRRVAIFSVIFRGDGAEKRGMDGKISRIGEWWKGVEAKGTAKRRGNVAGAGYRATLASRGVGRGWFGLVGADRSIWRQGRVWQWQTKGSLGRRDTGTVALCSLRFYRASVTLSFFHPCGEKAAQ